MSTTLTSPRHHPAVVEGWTVGRIVAVVAGVLLGMISLVVLTGGTALLVADNAMRDDAGYVTSAA